MAKTTEMTLRNGMLFDYARPDEKLIDMREIADCLSVIPRFVGRARFECGTTWNVAEHSLLCWAIFRHRIWANKNDAGTALRVLLHDAHEAFTSDIPAPLKKAYLGDKLESREWAIDASILRHLGATDFVSPDVLYARKREVKDCDKIAFTTEYEHFFPIVEFDPVAEGWPHPLAIDLEPVENDVAAEAWLMAVAYELERLGLEPTW